MSNFCLMPSLATKLKQAIVDGKIDISKLAEMSSGERRSFFNDFFGNETTAKEVNALFESKLLLKNQIRGMVNWAKQITGIKPEVKRDLISRIQKMDKILNPEEQRLFLEDLASKRLGTDISIEEAENIVKLSNNIKEVEQGTLKYGINKRLLEKYVSELRVSSSELGLKDYLKNPGETINFLGGLTKSLRATLDNSFIGRQGIKVLFTNPKIWANNAKKSFDIIGRTIKNKPSIQGLDETDAILADIYSRPSYSKMKKAKLDIGTGEEAFPSSVPEKIPVIKRLFKASESAYTGTAYKMRADLFDKYLANAEKNGVNIDDKFYLESLGNMINSLTGRGKIKYLSPEGQKAMNNLLFSGKFLKSNIDTLTAHSFQKIHPAVRKEAAKNLGKLIGGIGATLLLADTLKPGSVEWDSTSSDFGKIKVGDTSFDITGGMGSIVVLASRIKRQEVKSTITGKTSKLGTGFGEKSGSDLLFDFAEGKLAPLASTVKQLFIDRAGYMGKELKAGDVLSNLFVPMPITNAVESLKNPKAAPLLMTILADGLGISANTYNRKKQDKNKKQSLLDGAKSISKAVFGSNEDMKKLYNDGKLINGSNDKYGHSLTSQGMVAKVGDKYRLIDAAGFIGSLENVSKQALKSVGGKLIGKLKNTIEDISNPKNFKTAEDYVKAQGKTVYRGEGGSNGNGNYFTTDKEFASEFAGIKPLTKAKIPESSIYRPKVLPEAVNESQVTKAIAEAKSKGYKAVYVDEGTPFGEPIESIFVIDKSIIKTKSQLISEWNKAKGKTPLKKTVNTLEQEAKKYKSVEEFVKAQENKLYIHGTQKEIKGSLELKSKALGVQQPESNAVDVIYLTPNTETGITHSRMYTKQNGFTYAIKLKPEAKIFDYTNPAHRKMIDATMTDTQKRLVKDNLVDGQLSWMATPPVKNVKKLGFDGMKQIERKKGESAYSATFGDTTYKENAESLMLFNKNVFEQVDITKTKSQLTDIWNKAQKLK